MATVLWRNDKLFSETRSSAATSLGLAAARVRHDVRMEYGVTLGEVDGSLGVDSSVVESKGEELDEARRGGLRSPSQRRQNPLGQRESRLRKPRRSHDFGIDHAPALRELGGSGSLCRMAKCRAWPAERWPPCKRAKASTSAERAGQFSRKKTLQLAGAASEVPWAGGGGASSPSSERTDTSGIKPLYMAWHGKDELIGSDRVQVLQIQS